MTIQNAAQRLSSFLYSTDPVGTCCAENEMYDEYDVPASILVNEHISEPLTVYDVIEFFREYFEYEGVSVEYAGEVIDVINSNK